MKKTSYIFLIGMLLCGLLSCVEENDKTLFTLMDADDTGIKFRNILKETEQFNVLEYGYLYNGGGVAIGDINNDSLPDIYFTGNMVGSRLYLNKGDWKFKEIAKEAGVFAEGLWNTGTTMADVNADGLLDIYVCRSAAKDAAKRRNQLFINNGDLTFTERGAEFGVDDSGYSTHAAFFDYDKDGDLDLYVLNHSTQEYAGFGQITPQLKNRKNTAYSDKLYKNEQGKFTDVSEQAGLISNVLGFGLGIGISDLNNDGWPDIYVSNDYNEQDYLYINNADGTFSERLEEFIGHTSLFSMGSDIADINNDGYTDIMTLDMLPEDNYRQKMVSGPDNYDKYNLLVTSGFYNQTMRNMLQLNDKGVSFSEIGQFAGISNTDWSWASLFADLDNDGYKDLFITNGYKRDYTNMDFMNYAVQEKLNENRTGQRTAIMELLEKIPSTVVENYTYHNSGKLKFTKVNQEWGMDQKSLSNGAAYADLDNDGDLDLVVNNIEAAPFVYKNNANTFNENRYLKIRLVGNDANTFGVGSKVQLFADQQQQVQELLPSRGYQSSVDYQLVFGLGNSSTIDSLTIEWPDGDLQMLTDIKANTTLTLYQKDAIEASGEIEQRRHTFLTSLEKDSLIEFRHIENNFTDFKREQLLPHKLSTQGPKMAKADVNGDGLEDLFIGGAKGTAAKLFFQTTSGAFRITNEALFARDSNSEDLGAVFFDADNDGDMDLYVVSGGADFDPQAPSLQDRIYFNNGQGSFVKRVEALPEMLSSGSCVSTADYDSDGDLDLFVGGRLVPGRYPTAARSYVLENDGSGNFIDATENVHPGLKAPGMVTDAIWTDINGDTEKDLILVGEWMDIRIFENTAGKLNEITTAAGVANTAGWWNTITAGDFDNDGDTDFILGNFGANSQLKASPHEPVELYVSDFDGNGSLDPVLCSYVMGESFPVFSKDDLVAQLNALKSRYVNYADYAGQKMTDIFSEQQLKDAEILKATHFESSYLENLGDATFRLTALPGQVQFSPIYSIVNKDINADGNQDLILSGNFFGTRVKYGRYDANRGLVMLGDGMGQFSVQSIAASGLHIRGEVRDALILAQADGKQLILFAQNNDAIQVYKFNQ